MSLDSSTSGEDITKMILSKLDKKNPLNDPAVIGNSVRDGIGLGMSNDKMLKFKFGDQKILGLVCSGN